MIITDWISPFHTTPGRSYDLSVQRHHQAFSSFKQYDPFDVCHDVHSLAYFLRNVLGPSFPVTSYLPVVSRFLAVQYEAEIPLLKNEKKIQDY